MPEVTRLYSSFCPKKYSLLLNINAKELSFKGVCKINGELASNNQKTVVLHSTKLDIANITVENLHADFKINDDELTITLPKHKNNTVNINIDYSGVITKAMHGIYPAFSADGDVLIATQFESHHAREAFPCVDEPEAKATFEVELVTNQNLQVLGNMPIKVQKDTSDDKTTTTFETTPIMSTYLLAFVIGKMHRVTTNTENGTEVSVWSTPNHDIESLIFPLEVAVKTIEFLNDYFGVDYPLPKLDQVALPDFSSGAMENWGLVTYRELALIADPETISTSSKEYIALVIAHELAHQWFGNLVTMKWWDDLWLNESFATLMEYLIIDALYPDWNVMLNFASHEALSAYRRDILPGVQPIITPVNHPDQISTLFDPSIVYAKGARLLYMAYSLVGNKAFKKGLGQYFEDYAYGNTSGDDLWAALSKSSGIDVSSIMTSWVTQPGLPYLTVENKPNNSLKITQNQLSSEPTKSTAQWSIPLWPDKKLPTTLLTSKSEVINKVPKNVRLNTVGGHYVCNYKSRQTQNAIFEQVGKKTIKPEGRLLLLHDSLLLAKCGITSITDTLEALAHYRDEHDESVWSVISLSISDARTLIEGNEEAEQELRDYTYNLIKSQFERLGWFASIKDSSNDKKLRGIIVSLAVYSENKEVIDQAIKLYNNVDSLEELPVDARGAILTAAVRFGKPSVYNKLFKTYPNVKSADIQLDITGALCATRQPEQASKLIDNLKNEDFVRIQDIDRFLVYTLRNRYTRQIAWNWLTNNWDWITEKFASDKSYDNYPRYGGSTFSSQQWLDAYTKHFGPLKDIPALTRNIELGIKDIENKIAWRKRDQQNVIDWLKAQ